MKKKFLCIVICMELFVSLLVPCVFANESSDVPPKQIEQLKGSNGNIYTLYCGEKTWHEAQDFCESIGGHLITINDIEEFKLCRQMIWENTEFWIGVTADVDISHLIIDISHWITGEEIDESLFTIEFGDSSFAAIYFEAINMSDGGIYLTNRLNNGTTKYFICETESEEIKVILNGIELSFNQPPIMDNGRVMVPIRTIFEAMGYSVNWNGDTQSAEAIKSTDKITVKIKNSIIQYTINGKFGTYKCDVVPQIISERMFVPVRAISESAGCDVKWDGENTTVIVTYYN